MVLFRITTLWGLSSERNGLSMLVKRRSFRLVDDKPYSIENKLRGSESDECENYEQKGKFCGKHILKNGQ